MSIDKSLEKSILSSETYSARIPSPRNTMSPAEINLNAPSAVDIMGEYRSLHGSVPNSSPIDIGVALAADAIRYLSGDSTVNSFMTDFVTRLPEASVAEPGHQKQLFVFMKTLFKHSDIVEYKVDTVRRSSYFSSKDPSIDRVILRQEIVPEVNVQPKICRFADPETMLRMQYKDAPQIDPSVANALKLIAGA